VLDQATKWWAWRDAPTAHINFGGDPLVGPTVGGWYANPVTGALLDLLSAAMLTVAVQILLRRRLPTVLRVSAALAIGGWVSNLLDRLGMHYVTAPGSIRGAVDFIHIGNYYVNVADFFIVGATLVLLLAHGHRRSTARHARTTTPSTARRLRASARLDLGAYLDEHTRQRLTQATRGAGHQDTGPRRRHRRPVEHGASPSRRSLVVVEHRRGRTRLSAPSVRTRTPSQP